MMPSQSCRWIWSFLLFSLMSYDVIQARPFDARAAELNERYGINAQLSSCLTNNRIEFVDAMRNDSHAYYEASQGDNMRFHWHPDAIVYPTNAEQVSEAVKCAARNGNVQTVARSGGHAFSGFSSGGQDGAMIVDFRQMKNVQPDEKNALVHVQPGVRLGDVAKTLWAYNQMAMPHGTCPTVGVGGHAICGGIGPTSRKWGMAMDNIVEVEIILANGTITRASQHENPDLFWAVRGSGVYYGLITKFTFQTYKVDHPVTYVRYRWSDSITSLDKAVKLMEAIQGFGQHRDLPDSLGFHVQISPPAASPGSKAMLTLQLRGMYLDTKEKYLREVQPKLHEQLKKVGMPTEADLFNEDEMTYLALMEEWDDFGTPGNKLDTVVESKRHNNFIARTSLAMGQKGFSNQGFKTILQDLWQRQVDEKEGKIEGHSYADRSFWVWNVYFELFGGAQNKMRDPQLTAQSSFAHRDAFWLMQASVGTVENKPLIHEAYQMIHEIDSVIQDALKQDRIERMSYSCYADPTLADWKHLYYGDSVKRMTELKKKYDSQNLFRNPQSLIETPRQIVSGLKQWILSPHPLP